MTSSHRFPWKWRLSDLQHVKKNGLKVFSCFACGGGSSMGYKLAGFDVVGNCEIDPKIAEVYKKNLHPRVSYVMDVRDFAKIPEDKIAPELFDLDILDGSPPCTTFSTAGLREKTWGVEKKFREGQKMQRLDDLFFPFIEVANRLRPKAVVGENVSGMIKGNAKRYCALIAQAFDKAGYDVQLFLLNASRMGVPQKRERVFFVARRKDLGLPKLRLEFDEKPILFGEVRSEKGEPLKDGLYKTLLSKRQRCDDTIEDIRTRIGAGGSGGFNCIVNWDDEVAKTHPSSGCYFRGCDGENCSKEDIVNVSTFPQDYDFGQGGARFMCGMCVPPVMAAQVASQIAGQWFGVK